MRVLMVSVIVCLFLAMAWAAAQAPEMASVEGEHIILKVRAEDMKLLDDPQAYVDKLDCAYEAYVDLVGAAPFGGEKITILSVEEYPGGWAVAGNPIRWHRKYVPTCFTDMVNKGDWLFGIMHEIGHDFDLDYRWVWDPELFANFKMDYVLEKCQATVILDKQRCDYSDPNGLHTTDLYRKSGQQQGTEFLMKRGGWSEPMHHKLTDMVGMVGWESMKRVYRWFNEMDADKLPEGGPEKRSLFIRAVEEQSGMGITDWWIESGFSYLAAQTDDAEGAAVALRAKTWSAEVENRPLKAKSGESVTVRVLVTESGPKAFEKGLGTHADSEIIYDLGGKYKTFESYVGAGGKDTNLWRSSTTAFEVVVDGKSAYKSPTMRGGGAYKHVVVDVSGVKELKLLVSGTSDGIYGDEAGWGDAKVIDDQGTITYLSDVKPVSAQQGYKRLAMNKTINDEPLFVGCAPCPHQAQIVATVDGKLARLTQTDEPGLYAYTFDGFEKGTHVVRVAIKVGDEPLTQYETITVQVN